MFLFATKKRRLDTFANCIVSFDLYNFHQDDTRKKAASTYLVENTDMPPPRYQKDGTLPINYPNNVPNSG